MARFDVYRAMTASGMGLVIDVQADVLHGLMTRVVVPLLPLEQLPEPARGLNPMFTIEGQAHVMLPQFMSSVPRARVWRKVGSLGVQGAVVERALGMVFGLQRRLLIESDDLRASIIIQNNTLNPTA